MRILPLCVLRTAIWSAAAVALTAVSAFSQGPSSTWVRLHPQRTPWARAACAMVYDPVSHKIVMFGGYNGQYLNDTWTWNGATSTWTQATPTHQPVPETLPMLFADPITSHVDEFGGYDGMFYQLTTWRGGMATGTSFIPSNSPRRARRLFSAPIRCASRL